MNKKTTKKPERKINQVETFFAKDQETWRKWLEENNASKDAIWLIYHKKHTKRETIVYERALDEALCFGWIDSTARPHPEDPDNSYMQYFCKRKVDKSQWSKKNKDRVAELIEEGKMTEHGLSMINKAKENGMWDLMNDVYDLKIPQDLKDAFEDEEDAFEYFESLTKSVKKQALNMVFQAKREATRQKRIQHIVDKCKNNEKPIF
ncbi:predicted protein [Naegleria gruberi]|uniref:Predicted protein n=1 Tax=Naegleria gruberi TaxID=5762 RepID=D2V6Y7_NAEGR|nr:uncharacterized protein NAEGRDRAFT_64602 [Naegleria gruberi]EFC47533.1 predicted protein [Naegleria gruberi]|eukprot:XP_002680277.1 predicted protein [Naegleria gruberi strain NEG-M]